jgi:glycosyltransferase involved in cell wall biosynthesis
LIGRQPNGPAFQSTTLDILLVTARYPWPPRRGDQLRTCQMLELLAPEHRVTLLTPAPPAGQPPQAPAPPLPPGASMVTYGTAGRAAGGLARAAVRGLPLQSGLFFSADLRRQLGVLAPRADLAVLQLVRLAAHRDDLGGTPVLVDLIDDLALNFSRRAAVDSWWLRPALALEGRLLARAQHRLTRAAAGVLLVCERDRREVTAGLPSALAGRVRIVGLAVEPGSTAEPAAGAAGFAGPPRLVFTGNLGYFVNSDAISWWLREVWPSVAARRPDLELVVAGDRPGPRLQRLLAEAQLPAAGAGAVTVVESPSDLPRVLAGAAAALAPMRCGSGVPVKILDAWSQGVPVVASPWAAAGTAGVPGEDLLVASSPRQWAEALDRLLQDPTAWRRLAVNGRRRLLADYSRQHVKRQLLAAVEAAASRQADGGSPAR